MSRVSIWIVRNVYSFDVHDGPLVPHSAKSGLTLDRRSPSSGETIETYIDLHGLPICRNSDQVRTKLEGLLQSSFPVFAAFPIYFSMYAFRKPFAAGAFGCGAVSRLSEIEQDHSDISAGHGHCTSKFIAVMSQRFRYPSVIHCAVLNCRGFCSRHRPWNVLCLVLNGLLGMIWGLVFGFLEGRRFGGSGVGSVRAFASGVVKRIGGP